VLTHKFVVNMLSDDFIRKKAFTWKKSNKKGSPPRA